MAINRYKIPRAFRVSKNKTQEKINKSFAIIKKEGIKLSKFGIVLKDEILEVDYQNLGKSILQNL